MPEPPKKLQHPYAPKALILLAAFLSFVLSVTLYFTGDELDGIFVGLWVPSILALGNMIVPRGGRR